MSGALRCLVKYWMIGCLLLIALSMLKNMLGIGVDDTDKSAWDRSGLTIMKDEKTGIEYLSDGKGGMIQRAGTSNETEATK